MSVVGTLVKAARVFAAARNVRPEEVVNKIPPDVRRRIEEMDAIVEAAKAGEVDRITAAKEIVRRLGLEDAADALEVVLSVLDELSKEYSGPSPLQSIFE